VEGFTTDIGRQVDVSAVDQDCNGNLTFREPAWGRTSRLSRDLQESA